MGASLGPKYIPYTYMDPLGLVRYSIPTSWRVVTRGVVGYPFLSILLVCCGGSGSGVHPPPD